MNETLPESVRRFYEARAAAFEEPHDAIYGRFESRVKSPGEQAENVWVTGDLHPLPAPEDYVAIPASVLEACGFYYLNVQQRDNGSLYVFQANADGTPTFGVLTTTDGDEAHLEVYGAEGELLGAALLGAISVPRSVMTWTSLEAVRRRAGIEGFE